MTFDWLEILFAIITLVGGGFLVSRRVNKGKQAPKPPLAPAATVAEKTEEKVTDAIEEGNDVLEEVDTPASGSLSDRARDF
ncbi:MAG: hypothetical protein GTO63_06350 [Anaerolineae bacterium]|nr:hypothetical protein [Anaerolineae bacterium]NIN94593.1 hypothetical protein [Anaerolineae bacterium]NIQ77654.1 hypothetical protein [Anaerolineae bacterium]